jgi:hypothetical protein
VLLQLGHTGHAEQSKTTGLGFRFDVNRFPASKPGGVMLGPEQCQLSYCVQPVHHAMLVKLKHLRLSNADTDRWLITF